MKNWILVTVMVVGLAGEALAQVTIRAAQWKRSPAGAGASAERVADAVGLALEGVDDLQGSFTSERKQQKIDPRGLQLPANVPGSAPTVLDGKLERSFRGVQLRFRGLTITRLSFDDPLDAAELAPRIGCVGGDVLTEVRGDKLVVVAARGPLDPARTRAALSAAWPGPSQGGTLFLRRPDDSRAAQATRRDDPLALRLVAELEGLRQRLSLLAPGETSMSPTGHEEAWIEEGRVALFRGSLSGSARRVQATASFSDPSPVFEEAYGRSPAAMEAARALLHAILQESASSSHATPGGDVPSPAPSTSGPTSGIIQALGGGATAAATETGPGSK